MDRVDQRQLKMYNILCVICADGIEKHEDIVAIKCGHIFHANCLSKWQIQTLTPSCPTCREKYGDPIKIFAQFQYEDDFDSPIFMENKILRQENSACNDLVAQLLQTHSIYEDNISHLNDKIAAKKDQIKKLLIIQGDRKKLLSMKENKLKTLHEKLKENAHVIMKLNTSLNAMKTKGGSNASAKLNAKNIELTKMNDDLVKQMEDLNGKLTAKTNELNRCQKAAAQKNKTIKDLKEQHTRKCNEPEHKVYAEQIKILKLRELNQNKRICNDPEHEAELCMLRTALMIGHLENICRW